MGFPHYNFAFATTFSFYTKENIFARKLDVLWNQTFMKSKLHTYCFPPIPSWSWVMLIELPVGKDYAGLWPIILWWYGDNAMLTLERVTLVSIGVMVDDHSPFCMSNILEKFHIATRSRVKIWNEFWISFSHTIPPLKPKQTFVIILWPKTAKKGKKGQQWMKPANIISCFYTTSWHIGSCDLQHWQFPFEKWHQMANRGSASHPQIIKQVLCI